MSLRATLPVPLGDLPNGAAGALPRRTFRAASAVPPPYPRGCRSLAGCPRGPSSRPVHRPRAAGPRSHCRRRMSATLDSGLAAPKIKGALRQRPTAGLLRSRAILYGIVALVIVAASLMLLVGALFKVGAAMNLVVAIWPAYVVAALAYVAPRGFRDRKLWSFGLSLLIGAALVGAAVLLIVMALNPATPAGPAAAASPAPGASLGPIASAVAGASGALASPAASGLSSAAISKQAQDAGNLAFLLITMALIFLALGVPLLWGLIKDRSWF